MTQADQMLAREGMVHCLALKCTMSLKQCVVNQKRGNLYPETLYRHCLKCRSGRSVRRHYQAGEMGLRAVKLASRSGQQEPAGRLREKLAGEFRPRIAMILDIGERLRGAGCPKPRVRRITGRLYVRRREVIWDLWQRPAEGLEAAAREKLNL